MKTVISVKVDKDVRDKAKKVAGKLGIPLSIVINGALRKFGDEQRVEFSVPLGPNQKTTKLLCEAIRDIEEGRKDKFSPAFTNITDMDYYLDRLKKNK
jgi:antitoxin component of RelBE/YafQ-DinJ toxin-antitoxin module